MKYSYKWLKELSGTKLSAEKLAEALTMRAFELEGMEDFNQGFQNVAVGEIKRIMKHPNADRLQLVVVKVGSKPLDIVCGAFNIAEGDKVPVALPGAKLLSGIEIKEAEIRGQKSSGMLCSRKDLGIGDEHEGIYILPKNARSGMQFADYLGLNDTQIEFDILPNRGHDALSHLGVAKDICALEKSKSKMNYDKFILPKVKAKDFGVTIKDKDLCRRYIGVKIENVEIQPSPDWMQSRLKVCGVKPINNIVDITNYVMLEIGQPMHAFDLDLIKSKNSKDKKAEIVVRRAKNKETMTILDGTELVLSERNLLITNGKKPLALAGVMGGVDSGINNETKNIILEAANFEPVSIRKTRMQHILGTESSYRFERDIDPNLAEIAAVRAIQLIKELAGSQVKVAGVCDIYPKPIKSWKIKLDLAYAESLLGEKIPHQKIKQLLEALGLRVKMTSAYAEAVIPTIRIDLKTQEDLIEEIGRIYGYENIKEAAPLVPLFAPPVNKQKVFEEDVRDVLIGAGFSEVLNYSFYCLEDAQKCNLTAENHIELANPMNPDQQLLRSSLTPNMLKSARLNLKNYERVRLFEIGRKYFSDAKGKVRERAALCGLLSDGSQKDKLIFALKGDLEILLQSLGFFAVRFEQISGGSDFWHETRTAKVMVNDQEMGKIGEISPIVLAKYGIKKRIAVFEMSVDDLLECARPEAVYQQIAKYPVVRRDISMFVPENVAYYEIESLIKKSGDGLVQNVNLFDQAEVSGKMSIAVRIDIGSHDKTLTADEADNVVSKIIHNLEKIICVTVRKG